MILIWFLTGPFLYLAAVAFVAGAAWKLFVLARMPRHMRWELYPLPHLGAQGSKYQHVDFASLPRHVSHARQLATMAEEVLILKKVLAGRRDLWVGSLLLHAGLYLGVVFLGFLAVGALSLAFGHVSPGQPEPLLATILVGPTSALGVCGCCFGLVGALYLLILRLTDRGLRDLSDPITFGNLVLLGAMFGFGLLAWLADAGFAHARWHLVTLLRGNPGVVHSPSLACAMVLLGVFASYLPLSRMFHFGAKYFFYHEILWDDEPLRGGGRMERQIAGRLGQSVSWSAAHIRQGRSWIEQLPENGQKGPTHDQ